MAVEAVSTMCNQVMRRVSRHTSAASVSHPDRLLKTAGPLGLVVLLAATAMPRLAAMLVLAREGLMPAAAVFLIVLRR